ncbi:MAG TPA: hypothetical protein VHE35_18635 [Kofleriaceae bacterium]|nr:hypothetical protein [Kofleriaceae bacterium]
MRRIALANGILVPALLALLPACGDDAPPCPSGFDECTGVCTDTTLDNDNCGACGTVCGDGMHCAASQCTSDAACTPACSPFGDCVDHACAEPLAAIQTILYDGKATAFRDLYALQDRTFTLTKLDAATFPSDRVTDHALLPDGSVLLVAAETEGVMELWRASPRGGPLVKVSGPLAAGASVLPGIVVSRDGSRVLYRESDDDQIDLYEVALASPGVAHKVDDALRPGGQVSRVFALSNDGKRVAYIATQDADSHDAYTVDLSGATPGPSTRLDPDDVTDIWDLQLTGDGRRVVYRREEGGGRLALQVVDLASPGVEHEITYADGAEGHVEAYQVTEDGSAVVFTGSRNTFQESLWRASLASPDDALQLVDGSKDDWVRADFAVTHDGSRVYFRQVSGAFGFDRLFRVDVARPGVTTQLSPDGDDSSEEATDFVLADDERSLVYRGGADGAEGGDPTPGTDPVRLFDETYAPALYHLDLTLDSTPPPVRLNPDPPAGNGVADGYVVSRDGRRTFYRADDDRPGSLDAYLSDLDVPGSARNISPPLDEAADATDVQRISRF